MSPNTTSSVSPRSGRARLGLGLALATALSGGFGVSTSQAEAGQPPAVGAGTEIDVKNLEGQVGDGGCNVAAVGYDTFDNKVALTAGHCGKVGFEMLVDGQTVGTFKTSKAVSTTGPNQLDYAFVKLNDDVVMRDDPESPVDVKSIVAPTTKQFPVCKYGHGILNTGERCGLTTSVTAKDFSTTVLVTPFDSGGPVYVNRTQLIGIVSRIQLSPPAPAVMTRADAAVADATSDNAVGAGFKPVA